MKTALPLLYHPTDLDIDGEFLEGLRRRSAPEGETGLMLAILEDAVACFQKYLLAQDRRGKVEFREAEDWILSEDTDWIFSFGNICDVLGLDPKYVRQGLMQWKERKLAGHNKAKVYHLPSRAQRKTISDDRDAKDNPNLQQDVRRALAL